MKMAAPGARGRGDSVIMTDMEYIRPRYTLVFSITAIFILVVLNVGFWMEYISVIIWAIAASQLVRPMTEDYVKWALKLMKIRAKDKTGILRLLFMEALQTDKLKDLPEQGEYAALNTQWDHTGEMLGMQQPSGHHQEPAQQVSVETDDSKVKSGSVGSKPSRLETIGFFVFSNTTTFLILAIYFHIMPVQYFLQALMLLSSVVVVCSVIMDYSGLTDTLLRSLARPELTSSMIIFGIVFSMLFVGATLWIGALFELADMASGLSNWISFFLERMSQQSSTSLVTAFSIDLEWLQVGSNKLYEYSNKEFGTRKWWVVIEALKGSFERGDPAETMARNGMEQMRVAYNNTEWLDLVEVAVMAAVPEHRRQSPLGQEFSLTSLISNVSLSTVWLNLGKAAWSLSSLSRDVIRYLSEFAGQFLVFFFILQKLCKSPRDVITSVCIFTVPATSKAKKRLNNDLQNGLKNAFTDPAVSAHKSALVVLLVYGLLNLPGAFISASFLYVVSALHIFPENGSLLACSLPWMSFQALRIFFLSRDRSFTDVYLWVDGLRAVALPILLIRLNTFANFSRRSKSSKRAVSPWLTDFSLAVGVGKFGADGVILGPFLAAVSYVVANFALEVAEQDLWWDDMTIAEAAARSHSMMMMAKRNSELGLHNLSHYSHSDDIHGRRRRVDSDPLISHDGDEVDSDIALDGNHETPAVHGDRRHSDGTDNGTPDVKKNGVSISSTLDTHQRHSSSKHSSDGGALSPSSSVTSDTRKLGARRTIKV